MTIKVCIDEEFYEVKQFVFNDGSVQVSIPDLPNKRGYQVDVLAQLRSPEDQMALIMATSVLKNKYAGSFFHLRMPFTPYGRQDQVFVPGEANAMKVWADVINNLGYDTVTVADPHSVAASHIDNLKVVSVESILRSTSRDLIHDMITDTVLVSPDAGANKKAHKICAHLGIREMVRADKARDVRTGDIIETVLYGDVAGKRCLIVDDICDGGRTFIELGKVLKARGATEVNLFVTHGIFSKGLGVFNGIIDNIGTTDSFYDMFYMDKDRKEFDGRFTVI